MYVFITASNSLYRRSMDYNVLMAKRGEDLTKSWPMTLKQ